MMAIFRKTATILITLAILTNTAVILSRSESAIHTSDVANTGLGEEPCIYNIWKAMNGLPVYQRVATYPYNVALYNWGFYYFYAQVACVLRLSDEQLVTGLRGITLVSTIIGSLGTLALVSLIRPFRNRAEWALAAGISYLVWFSASTTGWYTITVRPDIFSAALSTWVLVIYIRMLPRHPKLACLIAGTLFYLSWAAKQSCLGIMLGVALHVLLRRDFKGMILFSSAFWSLVLFTFSIGGVDYMQNTLTIPAKHPMLPATQLRMISLRTLLLSSFVWIPALLDYLTTIRNRYNVGSVSVAAKADASSLLLLRLCAMTSLALACLTAMKAGSDKNYFFEFMAVSGALCSSSLLKMWDYDEERPYFRTAMLLSCAVFLIPIAGAMSLLYSSGVSGKILTITPDQASARRELLSKARTLKGPILSIDPFLALPWSVRCDSPEPFVIDEFCYRYLERRNFVTDGGLSELVSRRFFQAIITPKDHPIYLQSLECGYVESMDSQYTMQQERPVAVLIRH
jgi:hypothetical protein